MQAIPRYGSAGIGTNVEDKTGVDNHAVVYDDRCVGILSVHRNTPSGKKTSFHDHVAAAKEQEGCVLVRQRPPLIGLYPTLPAPSEMTRRDFSATLHAHCNVFAIIKLCVCCGKRRTLDQRSAHPSHIFQAAVFEMDF